MEMPVHHEILLAILLVQKNSPPSLYRYVSVRPLNVSARPLNISIVSNSLFLLSLTLREIGCLRLVRWLAILRYHLLPLVRNPLSQSTYRLSHYRFLLYSNFRSCGERDQCLPTSNTASRPTRVGG